MNRRSYERFETRMSAVLVREPSRETVLVSDLSCRGACLTTRSQLTVSESVSLIFRMPFAGTTEPMRKKAVVAWCRPAGLPSPAWDCGLDFGQDSLLSFAD